MRESGTKLRGLPPRNLQSCKHLRTCLAFILFFDKNKLTTLYLITIALHSKRAKILLFYFCHFSSYEFKKITKMKK